MFFEDNQIKKKLILLPHYLSFFIHKNEELIF